MSMTFELGKEHIAPIYKRLKRYIRNTPVEWSAYYSRVSGADALLKYECQQITGSFKLRGAMHTLLSLSDEEYKKGVISVSAGNHALGLAHALWKTGRRGKIVLPKNASETKIKALREYPVELEFHGKNYDEAEVYTVNYAKENGITFISPYNDPRIIAGASTVGMEIFTEIRDSEVLLVPVGGGGLISSILLARNAFGQKTKIYGIQSEASPAFKASLDAGKITEIPIQDSIADGIHGLIEPGSMTFDIVMENNIEDILLVSEEEIKHELYNCILYQRTMIEGSAAATLAALVRYKKLFRGKRTIALLSGSNIAPKVLGEILNTYN